MPDTDTTDDLGEKGLKALAAEREARRAAEKSLADMAAKLEAANARHAAEFETLKARLAKQQDAAAAAALDAARQSVFRAKAVPAELEKYVTGASAEEIEASADAVLADFAARPSEAEAGPSRIPPDPSLGASGAKPKNDLSDDPFARAFQAIAARK